MTGAGRRARASDFEEAAIDGIPAIVIDPKGDLSIFSRRSRNCAAKTLPPGSMRTMPARTLACRLRDPTSCVVAERLRRMGSERRADSKLRATQRTSSSIRPANAGLPVSILKSFAASPELLDDAELLRERISTTVTSVLGLIGLQGTIPSRAVSIFCCRRFLTVPGGRGVTWTWRRLSISSKRLP